MFTLPANTRFFSQRLFHQRRGIDEDLDLLAGFFREGPRELFEALLEQVMIIGVLRIDANHAFRAPLKPRQRVLLRSVVQTDDHGRLRLRPHGGWMLTPRQRLLHPAHRTVMPVGDIFRQTLTGRPGLVGAADAGG